MYKLGVYIFLNRVPFPPSLKSCGFKNSMKLGGCQKNFKVTLLERPSEKSCSTSKYPTRTAVSVKNCQENFKVTLLERPPKKSCSTSKTLYEDGCFCQKIVFQKSSKASLARII